MDLEPAVRATLTFLEGKIDEGQIRHVRTQLPAEIDALWE